MFSIVNNATIIIRNARNVIKIISTTVLSLNVFQYNVFKTVYNAQKSINVNHVKLNMGKLINKVAKNVRIITVLIVKKTIQNV